MYDRKTSARKELIRNIPPRMPIDPYHLSPESLEARLAPLLSDGRASVQTLEMRPSDLRALGFHVEGDEVSISEQVERLHVDAIQAALSHRAKEWLMSLEAHEVVGSTNTLLGQLADRDRAHGAVRLAELQVQGRGRRGRSWQSPYGQNLALSLGMRLPIPPDELGGLSLCVGLAVVDALQSVGVDGAALKWPNDVLVDGRKIAGILVEIHRAGAQTDVIMGIGINFRLAEAARQEIDQPVIDLEELGGGFSRNELAGRLISSLVDFSDGFAVSGFAPMRQAFDRLHWFHDRSCTLLIGEQRIAGRVRGVTDSGELTLEIDGQLRTYNAGEVSLRAG